MYCAPWHGKLGGRYGVGGVSRSGCLRVAAVALVALCSLAALGGGASARVLRVGSYRGVRGQFQSVQAAVRHAHHGDWVLIGPGNYHENGYPGAPEPAGVLITTAGLHVRGMDRNRVVIDGTRRGASRCSPRAGDQVISGEGRDGVQVLKASGVSVENLTVCNYLNHGGGEGNQIWWNGGDGSGKIGLGSFSGAYLSATSTYYGGESTAAAYGLYSSNSDGPGVWDHVYTSNFNDSGLYIGACRQVCNQVIDHAHSQYSALGYSGTNSGGRLIVENSEFDHNQDGFDTNSQNNDDRPSPQDGRCPGGAVSPITHTRSCWVFRHNFVHDNNNPNVPSAGAASAGPVGTGMSVSGGRFDTITDNRFANNGAWGVILVPYPDTEKPPAGEHCQGGVSGPANLCLFDDWGNALVRNTFVNNGFFGNATNSDIAESTETPGHPINCYRDNATPDGTSPATLQQTNHACGRTAALPDNNAPFGAQVACDSQILGPCPSTVVAHYPRRTQVLMHPLPPNLPTMPDPCQGVPANPWCPGGSAGTATGSGEPSVPLGGVETGEGSTAHTGINPAALALAGAALTVLAGLYLIRRRVKG